MGAAAKESMKIPACLGGRYRLQSHLGSGTFGCVFEAIDTQTGEIVAIKISSPKGRRPDLLKHEAHICEGFGGRQEVEDGFPKFYGFHDDQVCYIVMERLGPNLDVVLKFTGPLLSLKTTLLLSIQMLARVERFHAKGFIHRDLKPHNFTMGWGPKGYTVFLIDFGLSTRFVDSKHNHIAFVTGKRLIGTPWYCSINAHDGAELSRRDDLESLFYVMLYLLRGNLPWQKVVAKDFNSHNAAIRDLKAGEEMRAVLRDVPAPLAQFYHHSRSLGFEKKPNYGFLRGLLRKLFQSEGFLDDNLYDWVARRQGKRATAMSPRPSLLSRMESSNISVSEGSRLTAHAPSCAMKFLSGCPSMASLASAHVSSYASADSDSESSKGEIFPNNSSSSRGRNPKKRVQVTQAKPAPPPPLQILPLDP